MRRILSKHKMVSNKEIEKALSDMKSWLQEEFTEIKDINKAQRDKTEQLGIKLEKIEERLFESFITTSKLEKENIELKKEVRELRDRQNWQEYKQNKSTLHLFNIPVKETPALSVKDFAKDILKIETEILIVEAKKIVCQGNPSVNHIIAHLADCQMANDIKTSMYKLPRKSHRFGVEEDLPKDWQEKRQKCYEKYVKPAKIAKKTVRWSA